MLLVRHPVMYKFGALLMFRKQLYLIVTNSHRCTRNKVNKNSHRCTKNQVNKN